MNLNQFTQKSLEAVQSARDLAVQNGHQQLEQVHLLLALLQQEGGLVPQLLRKMEITVESLEAAANAEAEAIKFRNASADAGDTQDGLNKKFEKAKISMNDWATSISNATSLIMGVGAAIASI